MSATHEYAPCNGAAPCNKKNATERPHCQICGCPHDHPNHGR